MNNNFIWNENPLLSDTVSMTPETPVDGKNRRVIVIDDNASIHEDVRKILASRRGDADELEREVELFFGINASSDQDDDEAFEIDAAVQGVEGIQRIEQAVADGCPYAVAFVDVRMPPGIDGIETTKRIWKVDPNVQVVLCTAYSDYSLRETLDQLGKSDRLLILKKPYDPVELTLLAIALTEKWNLAKEANRLIERQSEAIDDAQRVLELLRACREELEDECQNLQHKADRLSMRIQQQTVELLGTREITCRALAQLAESRDPETGEHLRRMQVFSQIIAEHLSVEGPYADQIDERFLEDLWRSSPLHDIGKVGIPDQILLKPGQLTAGEFELMKRHTTIGAEVLELASQKNEYGGFLAMAIEIARHHHERIDGRGYPDGLRGDQIPLAARIVAVADVFDALTSDRVYKDAMKPNRARAIIEADSGKHFDPHVVEAFRRRFPELLEEKAEIDSLDIHAKRFPLDGSVRNTTNQFTAALCR